MNSNNKIKNWIRSRPEFVSEETSASDWWSALLAFGEMCTKLRIRVTFAQGVWSTEMSDRVSLGDVSSFDVLDIVDALHERARFIKKLRDRVNTP